MKGSKVHYRQTLSETIADLKVITDLQKPVKDPRIVSQEEYAKSIPADMRIANRVITRKKRSIATPASS